MTDLQHIIVTRFNCRFGNLPKHLEIKSPASPQWLDERFALFERYCLPTLLGQTSANFTWFVYFDKQTPKHYIERAMGLFEGRPNMVIKLCDAFTTEVLKDDIHKAIAGDCKQLITTRLDNDDGLRSDFVSRLQSEVNLGTREALNFPVGIVFGNEKVYLSRQASNAFISISEPYGSNILTVYCGSHNEMSARVPVRDIGGAQPAWLQVIHGGNVSNKLRGSRVPFKSGSPGFIPLEALSHTAGAESSIRISIENASVSLLWAFRDKAARMYRRLRK